MIKIDDLIPLLKPGFVAMDKDGSWCWYPEKPRRYRENWNGFAMEWLFKVFDIAPFAGDWKDSLIEIKAKEGTSDPTNTKDKK